MLKCIFLPALLLLSVSIANGQEKSADTIRLLHPVEIVAQGKSLFFAGSHTVTIDSSLTRWSSGHSIQTVLAYLPQVTIKTNGPSGSSTLSIRGTQPTQSAVLWNGFNIGSSSMGMADVSLLPAALFDEVRLQYGGESALYGSGVIGGSLQVGNRERFNSPVNVTVATSINSYGNCNSALRFATGNYRLYSSTAFSHVNNPNRFKYTNLSGSTEKLEHAQFKQIAFIEQAGLKIANGQEFTAALWYQTAARNLPPSVVMATSTQHQDDRSIRASLVWKYASKRCLFNSGVAHINENMHFYDPTAAIDATYQLQRIMWESDFRVFSGKHLIISSGTTIQYQQADVPYYEGTKSRTEGSVFAAIVYQTADNQFKTNCIIRQDLAEGYTIPFCPTVGANWLINRNVDVTVSVSRNFRLPTMNDRFWVPGGNPDLKPESSWNQELGGEWRLFHAKNLTCAFNTNIYSIVINDNIQWIPVTSNLWSPINNRQIWSRGIELGTKMNWLVNKLRTYGYLTWNYSPSTYVKSYNQSDAAIGKQLIYLPKQKLIASTGLEINSFSFRLQSSWQGERYISSDNTASLPAFLIAGFSAGYSFNYKLLSYNLQLIGDNLFNQSYEMVKYYPEPGLNLTIKLIIHNLKNTQS